MGFVYVRFLGIFNFQVTSQQTLKSAAFDFIGSVCSSGQGSSFLCKKGAKHVAYSEAVVVCLARNEWLLFVVLLFLNYNTLVLTLDALRV